LGRGAGGVAGHRLAQSKHTSTIVSLSGSWSRRRARLRQFGQALIGGIMESEGCMMDTIEYRTRDKTAWGPGPWQDEPDKVQFVEPATGLPALIVRNRFGALCGYVGVTPDHPWHGVGYNECVGHRGCTAYDHSPESRVDVHGGLTFAAACADGGDESTSVCHIPAPGDPDHVWWFGFDMGHCDDYCPGYMREHPALIRGTYRDIVYVKGEIAKLARQLTAVHR
jgi:hypothetical protein